MPVRTETRLNVIRVAAVRDWDTNVIHTRKAFMPRSAFIQGVETGARAALTVTPEGLSAASRAAGAPVEVVRKVLHSIGASVEEVPER